MQVPNSTETNGHPQRFATITDAKNFCLAGNATITLESIKTGVHFTFKIRESKPSEDSTRSFKPVHFVNLLSGPDNENDYVYLGIIREGRFCLTQKSRGGPDAPSFKAFNYFWNTDHCDVIPPQLVVHHEMRCGRCGRTLTVPSSIQLGIGPDCAVIMGMGL